MIISQRRSDQSFRMELGMDPSSYEQVVSYLSSLVVTLVGNARVP